MIWTNEFIVQIKISYENHFRIVILIEDQLLMNKIRSSEMSGKSIQKSIVFHIEKTGQLAGAGAFSKDTWKFSLSNPCREQWIKKIQYSIYRKNEEKKIVARILKMALFEGKAEK